MAGELEDRIKALIDYLTAAYAVAELKEITEELQKEISHLESKITKEDG